MGTATIHRLKQWSDLVKVSDAIKGSSVLNPSFHFRGQARADWRLAPSLLRVAETDHLKPEEALELEQAALWEFRTLAHLYLPPAALPRDDRDSVTWWICMQHYGAPTRLLDWTESLYVASYFAVEKEPDSDGAIWMIHPATLRGAFQIDPKWPQSDDHLLPFFRVDAPEILYSLAPKYQTDRMGAQQTAFTVSPKILASHEAIIEKGCPEGDPRHRKIIVPKELKEEFLLRLRQMNITARALFPGIDGVGRSISELVRLGSAEFRGGPA